MSTPPEDHPSTPTAPRVSVVPEESIYQSFTTQGRSPPPQPQRTAEADEADLQMIRARQSQGQPLPQYQTIPRDPTSPEMEEQWTRDPRMTAEDGRITNPGVTKPRGKPRPLRLPHPRPLLDLKAHRLPRLHPHHPELQPRDPSPVPSEPRRLPVHERNRRPPKHRLFKSSG